jgi:hypothetical protein
MVTYCGILTLQHVGTAINYCGSFITLDPGAKAKTFFFVWHHRKVIVFVTIKPFWPNLIFAGRPEPTLKWSTLKVLIFRIKTRLESLSKENTPAYFAFTSVTKIKLFNTDVYLCECH